MVVKGGKEEEEEEERGGEGVWERSFSVVVFGFGEMMMEMRLKNMMNIWQDNMKFFSENSTLELKSN